MLAQILADHAADFIGAGHDLIQRAELRQPFDGCFGAALGDARHAVDGIANQGQIIDHPGRRHAKFLLDAGFVEHFVAHGIEPAHARPDQLGQILVAGGNQGLDAGGLGLASERADHVVGLDAVDHQERPAGGPDRGVQRFDLANQLIGHRRAVRLVGGKPLVAKGLALGIEDDGLVVGLVVAFQTT